MSENVGYLRFMRDVPHNAKRASFALVGDGDYLKKDALLELRSFWQKTAQADEDRFEGSDKTTKIVRVDEAIGEYPLIGKFRLVVVENMDKMRDFKKLFYWLSDMPPETKLVCSFTSEFELQKDSGFGCVVVCNDMSVDSKEFDKYIDYCLEPKKKSVDEHGRAFIKEVFVDQVHMLRMELLKVSYFVGDEPMVKRQHLEQALSIQSQVKIFDLVDMIIRRDLRQSLRLIKSVMDAGNEASSVINLVMRRVTTLSVIIQGLKSGEKLKDFMLRKKIPLFQFGQIIENLKYLKEYHISRFFSTLCEYEYRLRSWEDPRITLESMVVELCS